MGGGGGKNMCIRERRRRRRRNKTGALEKVTGKSLSGNEVNLQLSSLIYSLLAGDVT